MIISGKEFMELLPGRGGVPQAPDDKYLCLPWKFILEWERQFKQILYKYSITYGPQFDCNKFASLYKSLPQIIMPRTTGTAQSLAIAEIWYRPDRGGAHAVNVYVNTKGKLHWREPQPPCREIRPTPQEQRSVFCRILG